MRKKVGIVLIALLLVAGGVWWYFSAHPEASPPFLSERGLGVGKASSVIIEASGVMEAEEISITAEVGGRIEKVWVEEGDQVEEGATLIALDADLLEAQMRQAEAALAAAQANLARVEAGARPEEVRQAEALLQQAVATRDGTEQAWRDALALRDEPQELLLRIGEAESALAAAEEGVAQAQANLQAAEAKEGSLAQIYDGLLEGFDIIVKIPHIGPVEKHVEVPSNALDEASRQWNLASQETWLAWSALYQALAQRDGAKRQLELLQRMRDTPLAAQAQVDAARTEYEVAQGEVKTAQAQLDLLRAGPTEQQVAMAQAQVQQAEAELAVLKVKWAKMTLKAPRAGLILERMVEAGEMAAPGTPLLRLADLDEVTLTVYVPETDIGRVKVGQEAEVEVDTYPGRAFSGRVVFIAPEAEFTPQSVQTKEERVTLVFGVKIEIPNPDHLLRPGMPAEAKIRVEG